MSAGASARWLIFRTLPPSVRGQDVLRFVFFAFFFVGLVKLRTFLFRRIREWDTIHADRALMIDAAMVMARFGRNETTLSFELCVKSMAMISRKVFAQMRLLAPCWKMQT
jgi:hypothetical protein